MAEVARSGPDCAVAFRAGRPCPPESPAVRTDAQAEADRHWALADVRAAYGQQVAADQQRIAEIRARKPAYAAGDPETVEWFVDRVLDSSQYPRDYQVAYPPGEPGLCGAELPPRQVMPDVCGYPWRQHPHRAGPARRHEVKRLSPTSTAGSRRTTAGTPTGPFRACLKNLGPERRIGDPFADRGERHRRSRTSGPTGAA